MTWRLTLLFLFLILAVTLTVGRSSASAEQKYRQSIEKYDVPDVTLVNQDGKKVRLRELLSTSKPVIVDFIFGTCTTICPVLSAGYATLQQKLGKDTDKVHLVSISIDPENMLARTCARASADSCCSTTRWGSPRREAISPPAT